MEKIARDGLAESHHVFIDGTNFAETLHRHKHLTIAETGFGSGLNFLAVLDVLQKFPDCQPDYQIDYISFELPCRSRGPLVTVSYVSMVGFDRFEIYERMLLQTRLQVD